MIYAKRVNKNTKYEDSANNNNFYVDGNKQMLELITGELMKIINYNSNL